MNQSVISTQENRSEENLMDFDQTQSYEEGWCISECIGSSYFPDGWVEIERLDEADVFDSDFAATAYVYNKASEGSDYHRKAIIAMEKANFSLIPGYKGV